MNELKFNSQLCTTKEQSQRLLDLGLKPETADMVLIKELAYDEVAHCTYDADTYMIRPIDYLEGEQHRGHISAWSLHRLIEIAEVSVEVSGLFVKISSTYYYEEKDNVYDNLIDAISELINNEVFNKEYLKQ
jgi:hypothetical protein